MQQYTKQSQSNFDESGKHENLLTYNQQDNHYTNF